MGHHAPHCGLSRETWGGRHGRRVGARACPHARGSARPPAPLNPASPRFTGRYLDGFVRTSEGWRSAAGTSCSSDETPSAEISERENGQRYSRSSLGTTSASSRRADDCAYETGTRTKWSAPAATNAASRSVTSSGVPTQATHSKNSRKSLRYVPPKNCSADERARGASSSMLTCRGRASRGTASSRHRVARRRIAAGWRPVTMIGGPPGCAGAGWIRTSSYWWCRPRCVTGSARTCAARNCLVGAAPAFADGDLGGSEVRRVLAPHAHADREATERLQLGDVLGVGRRGEPDPGARHPRAIPGTRPAVVLAVGRCIGRRVFRTLRHDSPRGLTRPRSVGDETVGHRARFVVLTRDRAAWCRWLRLCQCWH